MSYLQQASGGYSPQLYTHHPSKECYMRETFYQQVKELGVLISKEEKREDWMIKGITVSFFFRDVDHSIIDVIIL